MDKGKADAGTASVTSVLVSASYRIHEGKGWLFGKRTLTDRSALWAFTVTASGNAITSPAPEVVVPDGTKTETRPFVCCVGELMVLTLTPELELAGCAAAGALEAELALETTDCTVGGALVTVLALVLAPSETVKVGSTELALAELDVDGATNTTGRAKMSALKPLC
jgi:hypothetical protein